MPSLSFRARGSFIFKSNNRELLLHEALKLAAGLNCLAAGHEGRPCGECAHCRQIAGETFPYWFLIVPQGAAELIQIRQIRELRAKLSGKAAEGQVKIAAFLDAHRMREESQNCLLKTLEEPPEETVLLLLTSRPQDLLPTVRSRCQTVDFADEGPPPEQTELDLVFDVIKALQTQGYPGVFEKAAFVDGSRKKRLPDFFAALELLLRNGLIGSLGAAGGARRAYSVPSGEDAPPAPPRPAPAGGIPAVYPVLAGSGQSFLAALDQVWRAGYLLERNVNPLLILENLFLQIKSLGIRAPDIR